jgi:outer membrane receptor protein involved in Fe transport
LSGHFESGRFADTANRIALKPFLLLNLTLNQELKHNLGAFLSARNLLNTSYESFASYPMPGLTLTAGLSYKR